MSQARSFSSALAATCASIAFGLGTLSWPDGALSQSVAEFYNGKQMKFIIRSAPGGGYDLYSRLLGSRIVRHIPGQPTMLPQNMPGAGGITAVNFMAEVAPQDGTHLTMISDGLTMDQALGLSPALKADLRKFGWIGHLGDSNQLAYTYRTSPTKTIEDARKRETTFGTTGAGSPATWLPIVFNNVLGTRFKLIHGYNSSNDIRLAMERGEIEGYGGNPLAALMSSSPDLIRKKEISILLQVGVTKEKDLPNVPLLSELASNPDDKAILDFISKSFAAGRPIGTTPGVPADRLAALRKAFDQTVRDPEFLAAAEKIGGQLRPVSGSALQTMMEDVLGAPQPLKDKVKAVLPPRS